MNLADALLRIGRSRLTWLVALPLLAVIIMNLILLHWMLFFPSLFIGILAFPMAVFVGLGISDKWLQGPLMYPLGIPYSIMFYLSYAYFVIKIKTIHKKTLLALSAIVLVVVLLGMRGCTQIDYSGLS